MSSHSQDQTDRLLSIIVVSWNTRALLEECIRSTHSATNKVELIVVDNASSDGTTTMVRERFPDARLIENTDNRGFSAANNQGLRVCSGEGALLLNSDTRVNPDALDRMFEFLMSRPSVGMVGCRLVDDQGEVQPSASGLPGLRMQIASFLGLKRLLPASTARRLLSHSITARLLNALTSGYFTPDGTSTDPQRVDFLSGACLMARRQMWEEVGLLDEGIFLFLEDADWCRRAAEAGWELWYLPDVQAVHLGGRSFRARSGGRSHHISRERCTSLLYYFNKHEPRWKVSVLRLVVLASLRARLITLTVRRALHSIDPETHAADANLLRDALEIAGRPCRLH